MKFIMNIWNLIKGIFDFINNYFKVIVLILIVLFIIAQSSYVDSMEDKPNLAKISLNFPIYDSEMIAQQIDEILGDENIKGVLLLIDSPGGSVGASIEIADMIKELNEKIPVVAYTQSLMASGAYYAGMYSNSIYANRGALIGSIGVIFSTPNIEELMKKIGIKMQGSVAGEYKEIGTITREWQLNERKFIENLTKEQYEMFYSDVLMVRKDKMTTKNPIDFAEGKIFTAKQALQLGLIDKIGSMNDAISELKNKSNVDNIVWLKKNKVNVFIDSVIDKSSAKIQSIFRPYMQASL